MLDDKKLFKKILKNYFQLSCLNPFDDLLEYFIIDNEGFRLSDDDATRIRFFYDFKKDLPTFDEFMGGRQDTLLDLLKYGRKVKCTLLQNYYDALEKRINLCYWASMNVKLDSVKLEG